MSSTNDLQALFANLRPKSREPSSAQATQAHPSASASSQFGHPSSPPPPFSATNPAHLPNDQATSRAVGHSTANSANAQSLLSLLNFGSAATSQQNNTGRQASSNTQYETTGTLGGNQSNRPASVSASDLVARYMSPPITAARGTAPSTQQMEDQGGGGGSRASDPSQDALLKLLSKASISGTSRPASVERSRPSADQPLTSSLQNGTKATAPGTAEISAAEVSTSRESKTGVAPAKESKPLFTYTNPFEALNASRAQTPKASTPAPALTPAPPSPIFKGLSDIPVQSVEATSDRPREGTPDQLARRKKLTPRLPSASKGGTLSREGSIQTGYVPESSTKYEAPEVKVEASSPVPLADIDPAAASEEAVSNSKSQTPDPVTKTHEVTAKDAHADEWEDAEDSPAAENAPREVFVYNFPIKPFVSITLQLNSTTPVGIREDGVMEISRLKKEFDQLDRSLAAATTKYISYALVKNGGMRIIRQDDGSDRQVFKNSGDRIFNVAFCTTATITPPTDDQAVLGTGVSGAVYYATVSKDGNDLFEKNELDSESLIFPPWPPADENTAGGVLKTRAKRSSRHSEFFAIGRGKSIHLIWPATAMSPKYGIADGAHRVDVEKLYQERSLQISTGKAGKDFIFSEDDSLIVSLDKTGRLRFWDIRELTDETNATSARVAPITVDTPLLSLSTASPAEKSWPTSVLFVDKARPYLKGGALRYVLVGLRQNHTLQLWDVALGKAVQELNFSHENETDGICSVSYHPQSGIIVVGHPTRNSLFFIHLSAPRYTLSSSMTQATYIQRIAAKDSEVPKPDSTACMSGIREISFAEKGQLRSVELLPLHRPADASKTVDDKTPLFELYVVHSKGVTCLNITKEDLGWSAESKVLHPIDASKEGYVSLKELKLGSVIEESNRSKSPVEEVVQPSKSSKKKTKKAQQASDRTEAVQSIAEDAPAPTPSVATPAASAVPEASTEHVNGETQAKESKKNKKKPTQTTDLPAATKPVSPTISPAKVAEPVKAVGNVTEQPHEPRVAEDTTMTRIDPVANDSPDSISVGISGEWLDKEMKKLERAVGAGFKKELNNLYTNIQNDRIVQDSSAVARQEAVLRLVSTTLTTNVEKSLSRILATQIQQVVVPSITGATVQAVTAQVGDALAKTLHTMIPHELSTQLPVAVNTALSNPQLSRSISDTISHRIAKQTENALADALHKQVIPAFRDLALSAAEKAASDVEARMTTEIRQYEVQRQHDTSRLEKIMQIMEGMSDTIQTMSDTQLALQEMITKDKQHALQGGPSVTSTSRSRQVSTARMTPSPAPATRSVAVKPKSKEQIELEGITALMEEGRYEEGSIKWLQSSQPIDLFDNLFVRFTPEYLASDVSPLVAFSVAVTVGNSLETNIARRLEWIAAAFDAVDLQDPEISDLSQHAPSLVGSLIQKLESLYMTIAERDSGDPVLRQIPIVVKKAKDIRATLMMSHTRPALY